MNPETIRQVVKEVAGRHKEGYLIVRAQSRSEITIKLNNGRIENISTASERGMGVQAFTVRGASGFASANEIQVEKGRMLAEKALALAAENERLGCELNKNIFTQSPNTDELINYAIYKFDSFWPEQLKEFTALIHGRLREINFESATLAWQTSYRQVEDFWCIGRSDGTLVSFFIPRAVLFHQGTVKTGGNGQSFSVHRSGVDAGVLLAEQEDYQLHRQSKEKAEFILKVCTAPQIPAGSYPLLIDYGLAKGLAHEAFGHAVESDLLEESVLSENGKLKIGMVIAGKNVNIIDGSWQGDWAYQPYSANGLKRDSVIIVENGILKQGLGDVFSAAKAGMAVTGAGRAEYYGSLPLPRMTNIRLVIKDNIPLPESNGLENEIKHLKAELAKRGLLAQDYHFLLLGYRGGQVNIKTGDFVFQCEGAVNLADPDFKVYRPGIFSGKILSVLKSVKLGLGKERFDAIGACGKAGQMVPSSGGGSGYILLDKNENVRLGGNDSGNETA